MAGKGSGGAEADVAPEAAAAPAGRSYSPGHTQSTGGSVGNSAAIAPPLSSARQTSGEAQAEIFSPSAPTSVLAGPLPPLDRTAITADVDANTMVRNAASNRPVLSAPAAICLPAAIILRAFHVTTKETPAASPPRNNTHNAGPLPAAQHDEAVPGARRQRPRNPRVGADRIPR